MITLQRVKGQIPTTRSVDTAFEVSHSSVPREGMGRGLDEELVPRTNGFPPLHGRRMHQYPVAPLQRSTKVQLYLTFSTRQFCELASFAANPSAIPWHMKHHCGNRAVSPTPPPPTPTYLAAIRPECCQADGSNGAPEPRAHGPIVQQWSTNPIVHYRRPQSPANGLSTRVRIPGHAGQKPTRRRGRTTSRNRSSPPNDLRTETALFYQSQYAKLTQVV